MGHFFVDVVSAAEGQQGAVTELGAEYVGEPQVVYVHIRWLREKIEADPKHPQRIVTMRGVGYKLEPDEF